jgi:hypothetical protein
MKIKIQSLMPPLMVSLDHKLLQEPNPEIKNLKCCCKIN